MIVTIKNPTFKKIKNLVDDGIQIYWANNDYTVIKDSIGQYLVKYHLDNSVIGLADKQGNILNTYQNYFYCVYDYLITQHGKKNKQYNFLIKS